MASSYKSAFKSKIRITENKSPKGDNPADQRLACDFTVATAKQAANWLVQRAKEAELEGETIRVYTSREDYTEEPGFTMWGSLWGTSGSISPAPVDRAVAAQDDDEEL